VHDDGLHEAGEECGVEVVGCHRAALTLDAHGACAQHGKTRLQRGRVDEEELTDADIGPSLVLV